MSKPFVLSDNSKRNSKGFRLALSGGRYERFDSNPVMLNSHNPDAVIGRWENRRIEGYRLIADPVFDLKDPAAAEIARKVEEGFIKGASLGIIPHKAEEIEGELWLTDWEPAEGSITSIPSDAGALRFYNDKLEELSFDQVKVNLGINSSNTISMETKLENKETTIALTAATCVSLGLEPGYSAKDIELAVAEKDKKIKDLQAENEKIQKAEITTYLTQAAKDGKITAKQIPHYEGIALKMGLDSVRAIIDEQAEKPSASLKQLETKSNPTGGDRAGWDYMKWMKEDPRGLQRLRSENPTEFERLQATLKQ